MPKMDGGALEKLRQGVKTPIMMLTARGPEE